MSQVAQRVGYLYGKKSVRKALCITSYFRKPDQGVHNWEELSRSSAFLVRTKRPSLKNKFHVLSAAHVTHPFLYPKLYPEEFPRFLSFLSERDVKVMLQLRHLDFGSLLAEFELQRFLSVKTEADLVVGHLADEDAFEQIMLRDFSCPVEPLTLATSPTQANTNVELLGHDFSLNSNGHPVLVPVSLPGSVLGSSHKRIVIETPQPSVMGLCGGPVVTSKDGITSNEVIGMVEGRIQTKQDSFGSEEAVALMKALADRTVLVSSQEMAEFLELVEAEMGQREHEMMSAASMSTMPFPDITMPPIEQVMVQMDEDNEPPKMAQWNPNRKAAPEDEIDL